MFAQSSLPDTDGDWNVKSLDYYNHLLHRLLQTCRWLAYSREQTLDRFIFNDENKSTNWISCTSTMTWTIRRVALMRVSTVDSLISMPLRWHNTSRHNWLLTPVTRTRVPHCTPAAATEHRRTFKDLPTSAVQVWRYMAICHHFAGRLTELRHNVMTVKTDDRVPLSWRRSMQIR